MSFVHTLAHARVRFYRHSLLGVRFMSSYKFTPETSFSAALKHDQASRAKHTPSSESANSRFVGILLLVVGGAVSYMSWKLTRTDLKHDGIVTIVSQTPKHQPKNVKPASEADHDPNSSYSRWMAKQKHNVETSTADVIITDSSELSTDYPFDSVALSESAADSVEPMAEIVKQGNTEELSLVSADSESSQPQTQSLHSLEVVQPEPITDTAIHSEEQSEELTSPSASNVATTVYVSDIPLYFDTLNSTEFGEESMGDSLQSIPKPDVIDAIPSEAPIKELYLSSADVISVNVDPVDISSPVALIAYTPDVTDITNITDSAAVESTEPLLIVAEMLQMSILFVLLAHDIC